LLRFVVALAAEARPLISSWRLERDVRCDAFGVYRRDDVALAVSGPGKTAAAAACAFLHLATGGVRHAAWLNVGVAGHGSLEVGRAVLAHKVRDQASGRSWYPPHVFRPGLPTDVVTTVERVERRFADEGVYEMEASGFYPTACRFSSAELVQCVKVVSDGPDDAPERLTARRVESLIEARMASIAELAGEVALLSAELSRLEREPAELRPMLERFRFTFTEERQLRRLLERWWALKDAAPLPEEDFSRLRRGEDVIRRLRALLDVSPAGLDG
jgi:nucleoside phosphorylase